MWKRLLVVLDQTLGFENKVSSNVVKKWQGYDNATQEHVIHLEYRVKPMVPDATQTTQRASKITRHEEESLIKELLRHLAKRS